MRTSDDVGSSSIVEPRGLIFVKEAAVGVAGVQAAVAHRLVAPDDAVLLLADGGADVDALARVLGADGRGDVEQGVASVAERPVPVAAHGDVVHPAHAVGQPDEQGVLAVQVGLDLLVCRRSRIVQ
jgi:hypothetical protein